ncbi:MAG: tRNA 2-selenouridine(34) synthase MnmH, partial [Betaproteobacteria bacterium]|nr:tRNA 2-selenouridine(34) synthase MnmH [Betaproteobacteria bacterium]
MPLDAAGLAAFDQIIDVRSPGEFALDHLPGAINLTVLDDAQRAAVGTLYKQESAFAAKKIGAAWVAANIARHLQESLAKHPKSWKPLVYCWRGGSRSGAMTHILRSIGWDAKQLAGGYKAWRGQVIADLHTLPEPFDFRVICGRTGSGKSRLLEALAAEGAQVLDLEQLAAHKGSVLGELPGESQPSQKSFESSIWATLSAFDAAKPVFVEAESKKVGDLRVPQPLIERMWLGACIEVQTSAELRVRLLREEYAHFIANPAHLLEKLDCLSPLHNKAQLQAWIRQVRDGNWDEFVAGMLENHYDPAYEKSMFSNYRNARAAHILMVADISAAGFRKEA